MSSYREERRRDQIVAAEQAREDKRLEFEAQLAAKREEAEQRRRDEAAKAEQRRKDEARADARRRQEQAAKDQARKERKAARAAKRARVLGWLRANPADLFVGFVMAASVVPAVISQVGALTHAGVLLGLAVLLAAMVEGGVWAITFMGKKAEDAGQPTGKFRAAGWATAFAAGGINLWHWSAEAPLWVALVFGASSVFAFFIWDLRTHGSEGPTKEERAEARARRRHAKNRRAHHKGIADAADRLLSAAAFGELTESEAFAAAWRIHYGTDPGMTPALYRTATAARLTLAEAFGDASESRAEMVRAGLLAGLYNPVPHTPGAGIPRLGPSTALDDLQALPQGATTQFPLGEDATAPRALSGPHSDAGNGAGEAAEDAGNDGEDRSWERHLPRAREVAVELVAAGKTISATALAKRLRIRRKDAIKVRDAIVAERMGTVRPLRLVTDDGDDSQAVSA